MKQIFHQQWNVNGHKLDSFTTTKLIVVYNNVNSLPILHTYNNTSNEYRLKLTKTLFEQYFIFESIIKSLQNLVFSSSVSLFGDYLIFSFNKLTDLYETETTRIYL